MQTISSHRSTHNWGSRNCSVPTSIVAHGVAANDAVGVLRLEQYLAKHETIPALLVLQHSNGHVPTARAYNFGQETQRIEGLIRNELSRTRGDLNAALNAMHAFAVGRVRACSIWEVSTNLTLVSDESVTTQIARSLRPSDPVGSVSTPFHLGVRPRGTSGPDDATFLVPVVNAHTLFSPSTYYAPRGYPADLLHDDERGRGPNAPELVRIGLNASESESAIAVVQSIIDGAPDTAGRYAPARDEPIEHTSFFLAIVLPQGVFHPYNRLATLHRYDALWALFTPGSFHTSVSDVPRGYVAQAIFPIIGRHLAIAKPLVSRENDARVDEGPQELTPIAPLVARLAKWSLIARDECKQDPRTRDCSDAGTLLVAAYTDLANFALCEKQDAADALLWISKLRSSGYKFPVPALGNVPPYQISLRRPPTLNVHAAVQVNWGNHWRGVVPLWHAMHAAGFKQVTYHVQGRPDTSHPTQSAGIYPRITHSLDDPPGITSGYLGFQSAIQAWSVHDRSTEALLVNQDDAFTDLSFLAGWLKQTSSCVAASGDHTYLPFDVTEWASKHWYWAKTTRAQTAGKHFLDLVADRGETLKCVGREFAEAGFAHGQSDVVAIRTRCNGTEPRLLFDLLQAASDAGLFLEIGWPACIRCAFQPQSITGYRLYTRWDAQRNNASAYSAQYAKHTHDVYHPLKLTSALMTRLSMRDDGWMQWWALHG